MDLKTRTPKIVASTTDTYCCTVKESRIREVKLQDASPGDNVQTGGIDGETEVNYFKSAQWYACGPR
jgi:hypothetical protein